MTEPSAPPQSPPSSPFSTHSAGPGTLSDLQSLDSLSDYNSESSGEGPGGTDVASEDELDQTLDEYDMLSSRDFGAAPHAPSTTSSSGHTRSSQQSVADHVGDHSLRFSYPAPSSRHDVESRGSAASESAYSFVRDAVPSTSGKESDKDDDIKEAEKDTELTPLSSRLVERDPVVRHSAISHWLQSTGGAAPRPLESSTPRSQVSATNAEGVFTLEELASVTSAATPPPLLSASAASTRLSTPELLSPTRSQSPVPSKNEKMKNEKPFFRDPEVSRPPSVKPLPFGFDPEPSQAAVAHSLHLKLEQLASTAGATGAARIARAPLVKHFLVLLGAAVVLGAASALLDVPVSGVLWPAHFSGANQAATGTDGSAVASTSVLPSIKTDATMANPSQAPSAHSPPSPCPHFCALSLVSPHTSVSIFHPRGVVTPSCSPTSDGFVIVKVAASPPRQKRPTRQLLKHSCSAVCPAPLRGPKQWPTARKAKLIQSGGKKRRTKAPARATPKFKRTTQSTTTTHADRCFHRHTLGHRSMHPTLDLSHAFGLLAPASRRARLVVDQLRGETQRVVALTREITRDGTRAARALIEGSKAQLLLDGRALIDSGRALILEATEGSHDLVDFQTAQKWAEEWQEALRRPAEEWRQKLVRTPVAREIKRAAKGYGHLRRGEVGVQFSDRKMRVFPKSCEAEGEESCGMRKRRS
ncbi:hypothetical protein RQP46_011372 [Phenoliferia psychrophenolica]